MLLFTVINILGVRWLAESNTITVFWKITVPVLTVIALIAMSFHAENFTAGGGFTLGGLAFSGQLFSWLFHAASCRFRCSV
jgi:amino acid transporter